MSSNKILHSIYTFMKPRSYHDKKNPIYRVMDFSLYPEKDSSLQLNAVTFKEIFLRNNYFFAVFSCKLLFHQVFCTSASTCSSMLFQCSQIDRVNPAKIYFFKFNSTNTTKRHEICPKVTINTTESRSDVFTVNNVKCFYCRL